MFRRISLVVAVFLAFLASSPHALAASGGKPLVEHGQDTDTFADDFILDLCGIDTMTTLTETVTVITFQNCTRQVHVSRTYAPADVRIPIEKGAGTSFYDVHGTQTVKGTPIHLVSQTGGGTILLDAGQVTFADELEVRGPHPSLSAASLAPYYCPHPESSATAS